ncbi:MAG: malectin domain-containing carbohydrate-binding protein, partial [Capsulimonadaceae bacterium]
TGAEGATPVATDLTGVSYTDTGLTNGSTYYFKVAAVDVYGTSALSNELSAAPSNTGAVLEINSGGPATGAWMADADFSGGGEDSWTNAVGTSLLSGAIPPQSVLQTDREGGGAGFTYTLPGFTAGSPYNVTLYFVEQYWTAAGKRIFSVTANGTTVISNLDIYATAGDYNAVQESFTVNASSSGQIVLQFTPSVDQAKCSGIVVTAGSSTPPAAPTGLAATPSNGQVSLAWTGSSGATSYNVYVGTSSGGEGGTPVAAGISTPAYTETGLTNATAYFFKVAAANSAGTSGFSNEATATPEGSAPAAPAISSAVGSNTEDTLVWTASTFATSYNVYRGTASGGEAATPVATSLTGTSYADTGLTNGSTYYYTVAAVDAYGTSAASNELSATPTSGPTIAIDSGGAASAPYLADTDFSGGAPNTWTTTVSTTLLTAPIPSQTVLQSDREAPGFTYTIPGFVANSTHTVTLYFVEQYWTTAGERIFSVTANGVTVISNLDVYGTAGADYKAIQETFTTTASSTGQIVLAFTASKDQSKCSGIAIY